MDRNRRNIEVVIIDDEPRAIRYLSTVIDELFPELKVVGTASSVKESIDVLETVSPDIIFLDVELTDGKGFDVLELANIGDARVIMVTAYDEYAIKAIKVRVEDYILKPLDPDELRVTVDRIVNEGKGDFSSNKITIKQIDRDLLLSMNSIVILTSEGSYTKLLLDNGDTIVASRNLLSFEEELNNQKFCRCHRSHIVNMSHVKSLSKDKSSVELSTGLVVPISRGKKALIIEKLNA